MDRQKGFTFIEVVAALVIVAIALSALTHSLGVSITSHENIDLSYKANLITQDKMNKVLTDIEPLVPGVYEQDIFGREWIIDISTKDSMIPGYKVVSISTKLDGHKHWLATSRSVSGGALE